jgi:MoxR-like ATPase
MGAFRNGDPILRPQLEKLRRSLQTVIRGKDQTLDMALTCLLAGGHLLIEDVPGVGKTSLAHAVARGLDCTFRKIQFTSDLLPSDLTGVAVFNPARSEFEFRPGPLFANVVLADEINRTTPKTQSALLEAMNDGQITVDGQSYPLPLPFLVIATQNPIEHHGTYPLPESQLDRFLMRIRMGYPDRQSETEILRDQAAIAQGDRTAAMSAVELLVLQEKAATVAVDPSLSDYLIAIVERTRASEHLHLGVSPRGSLSLYRAARAKAFLHGRDYVIPDDIKSLAVSVLAHRVVVGSGFASPLKKHQEAESIIQDILDDVEVPV